MDAPHSPEAPRDPRGASSWARRLNESTVDWLAAYCRVFAVAGSVVVLGAFLLLIWWPSWAASVTAVLLAAWVLAHAWFGFVYLANPEWKDADRDPSA